MLGRTGAGQTLNTARIFLSARVPVCLSGLFNDLRAPAIGLEKVGLFLLPPVVWDGGGVLPQPG